MDLSSTTGGLESGREGAELRMDPYRSALEVLGRLHGILDPDKLTAECAEAMKAVLGPVPGLLIVRQPDREVRHLIGPRLPGAFDSPHGHSVIEKTIESGHPVVDGQGESKTLSVPMQVGTHRYGAFVIRVAELERRHGNTYVDLARLLGRHFAAAFANATKMKELAERNTLEGGGAIPPGLSLRDSKRQFEHQLIKTRVRDAKGNIAAAARSLDMDRGQLSRLLKKHSIDKIDFKPGRRTSATPPPFSTHSGGSEGAEQSATF